MLTSRKGLWTFLSRLLLSTVAPRPVSPLIVRRVLLPGGGTLLSDDTPTLPMEQRRLITRIREQRMMRNGLTTVSRPITILITTTTPTSRHFLYVNGPTLTALMSPRS